jgi:Na+-transporting NADH:ubiquinone oxidoreductase subunit F
LKNGTRLACQREVTAEVSVKIPEDYFTAREYKAEVISIKNLTYDIKAITLRLLSPTEITFKAGQYIELRIPPYGTNKRFVLRAYSIASPPSERSVIELQIRRVLKGVATTYIFEHLKEGDRVVFYGAAGNFFIRDTTAPMLMIAGGSGMAPMKSILLDMLNRKIRRKVRYFFGARAKRDLFCVELLEQLEKQLPDFEFIPALSSPDGGDNWNGEVGLISEVVQKKIEAGEFEEAYLCGSPAMLGACVNVLTLKGIRRENIFFDSF